MRLLVLFLSLFSLSLAQPVVNIDSDKSAITDFELSYFIDDTDELKFEDVASMKFVQGKNRDSLGVKVKEAWIKIELFNATKEKQRLFLHQDVAYKYISLEYFETDSSNNLIKKELISPYSDKAHEQLSGADAIFEFTLDSHESKTIYVHQKTPAYHFYNFFIFSQKESTKYLIYEKVDSVLISGLLLALALYNFLIFISSRYKEYLYYSLYLLSTTLWIFYAYGSMAHYFQVYGDIPVKFNFGMMLSPIFLALFIQTIFKTKEQYINEHKLLNSIIFVSLANFIYGLIDFNSALEIMSSSLTYALIVFMWISIRICKKGDKLIKIFLIAHTLYLIFSVYALLYYLGIADANYISSHGTSIGLIIEAMLLSYLVSYKFIIMEQEKEEEKLKQIELKLLASTDSMTKLYNRRYFTEISAKVLHLSKREKNNLSILMIDIDRFKVVNDTYGHQFGDEVLIALSRLLVEHQRKSDIVCRYGGEEFVILLPNTSLKDATNIAQKIRILVESLTMEAPTNKEFKFTISIGVAQIDVEHEDDIKFALKRADDALYRAKNSGRNRVCAEEIK
ncbi:diguanylate cyclase [Sulfurimonas denitrificans DSM 1251]|uniref:diguanylate cyclase n=1 Tax=Sulfurimonas denitrificans (strain ATCC 33889 / DSM 1251) TaxID=326298 RepID=Q30QX5_SULDN|nr:diguanylate cyclase [Sulfurimonas denitrificans]ABB44606.1 diguanylate cyclase [Sulfurimonas denitrificans DSM 1251]MDD3443441.1 sensor domain-containing diguanylate cyclase [Sulfurimonas denitrificans]